MRNMCTVEEVRKTENRQYTRETVNTRETNRREGRGVTHVMHGHSRMTLLDDTQISYIVRRMYAGAYAFQLN